VLAAGAWTGRLVAASGLASGQGAGQGLGLGLALRPGSPAAAWADAFQPRRGHLLELARPAGMAPLTCGLMEAAYAKARARNPNTYALMEAAYAKARACTLTLIPSWRPRTPRRAHAP